MVAYSWYCECCEILESDIVFNPAFSWTADKNYAEDNPYHSITNPTGVLYYYSALLHEMGHSWGMQTRNETYNYNEPTVMHGYVHNIIQDRMTIHVPEAYLIRRNYDNQTSIRTLTNMGVFSKYAQGTWRNSWTTSSYFAGDSITINNITVENTGTTTLSNVHIRLYLSTTRTISTGDTLIGDWSWDSFTAETYSVYDFTTTIPSSLSVGTYYVGAIITYNGYSYDGFSSDNTTRLWDTIYISDNTPPNPNPLTWSSEPSETSISSIAMTATTASDSSTPITYYFDYNSSPTGGSGGTDSGWVSNTSYTDTGLSVNHQYGYRVRAIDGNSNATAYSSVSYDYTDIEIPSGITFGTVTTNSIPARSTNTPSGLTRGSSGLIVYNDTRGTNSGWKTNNNYWTSDSLTPNTQYGFRAKARNGDSNETGYSSTYYKYTLANQPIVSSFSAINLTSIRANWSSNGNPTGTNYYFENTTKGTNSGWTSNAYWVSAGLACGSSCSFRFKARNADGFETSWTSLVSQNTLDCPNEDSDGDGGGGGGGCFIHTLID